MYLNGHVRQTTGSYTGVNVIIIVIAASGVWCAINLDKAVK